jgi:hypothetical protein
MVESDDPDCYSCAWVFTDGTICGTLVHIDHRAAHDEAHQERDASAELTGDADLFRRRADAEPASEEERALFQEHLDKWLEVQNRFEDTVAAGAVLTGIALIGAFINESGIRQQHDIVAWLKHLGYVLVDECRLGVCDLLLYSAPLETNRDDRMFYDAFMAKIMSSTLNDNIIKILISVAPKPAAIPAGLPTTVAAMFQLAGHLHVGCKVCDPTRFILMRNVPSHDAKDVTYISLNEDECWLRKIFAQSTGLTPKETAELALTDIASLQTYLLANCPSGTYIPIFSLLHDDNVGHSQMVLVGGAHIRHGRGYLHMYDFPAGFKPPYVPAAKVR